jgi:hypothetical protein
VSREKGRVAGERERGERGRRGKMSSVPVLMYVCG